MTLPNLITLVRLALVPVIVWLIAEDRFGPAFWLFVLSGISDGVDGYIARRFAMQSALGAFLDPLADKALLLSVFAALYLSGLLPLWLLVAVVLRDLLIMGAIGLSELIGRRVTIKPLLIGKATTVMQIGLAATLLAKTAFTIDLPVFENCLMLGTGGLTLLSGAAYLLSWIRHLRMAERKTG
ncbi:CDP-alcohol phosphatidyltransferase family protein [Stappia indica]|uniref:CDP-alcohol phosphatidyltransferase family protein n=1 Tax=Stappia indica TaxID=538381 RepID=UPI001CD5C26A|nr:CDP-alcohol phosphatidyltransferase family protein [Stappia indica]MCA1296845.1 CDP-alcohol phosphatidyltransferase family protein [Stappia indica]